MAGSQSTGCDPRRFPNARYERNHNNPGGTPMPIKSIRTLSAASLAALSALTVYAPVGQAFNFGNMMNPRPLDGRRPLRRLRRRLLRRSLRRSGFRLPLWRLCTGIRRARHMEPPVTGHLPRAMPHPVTRSLPPQFPGSLLLRSKRLLRARHPSTAPRFKRSSGVSRSSRRHNSSNGLLHRPHRQQVTGRPHRPSAR